MSSKLYFAITLLSIFSSANTKTNAQSQEWLWAKGIKVTSDVPGFTIVTDPTGRGDIYTCGNFSGTVDMDPGPEIFNLTSTSDSELFICKLDGDGNFLWAKALGGSCTSYENHSMAIDPSGNGNIYITGNFEGSIDFDPGTDVYNLTAVGDRDIFITKLNAFGDFIWTKAIGGTEEDLGYSVAVNPSGNGEIYITGNFRETVDFDPGADTFNLTSQGFRNVYISKLDSTGNLAWAKAIGGPENNHVEVFSMTLDPAGSGEVYMTGYFFGTIDFDPDPLVDFNLSAQEYGDVFISRFDGMGNFVWVKAMSGYYGVGTSIAIDPGGSGDVYTLGGFGYAMDFDPGDEQYILDLDGPALFISKLDRSGNFVWAKTMNMIDGHVGLSIALDTVGNGGVYTTGFFSETTDFDPGIETYNITSSGYDDIFISKLDFDGNFVWAKDIAGIFGDAGYSLAVEPSGALLVAGKFESPALTFGSITLPNFDSTAINAFIAKLEGIPTSLINTQSNTPQISMYPNPVNNKLTIVLDKDNLFDFTISIYNILGEVVYSRKNQSSSNEIAIDMTSLATGFYFISLDMNGNRVVKKVVKE